MKIKHLNTVRKLGKTTISAETKCTIMTVSSLPVDGHPLS